MDEQVWLEGFISVDAAIRAQNRDVYHLYIRRGKWDGRLQRLQRTAEAAGIPVEQVDDDFIAARAAGSSHGGIIALAGPRRFTTLPHLLAEGAPSFIVMLDGVEDPFNFGQAVRALYAAGAHGLVVRPRNWLSAAGIVARSSAGASEWMPMAVAETALEAAEFYKKEGLLIACTTAEQAVSIYEVNLATPLFILIGGEKRGITRSFLDKADLRLQIPYGRPFSHSLGTAASAAILAFEIMRQRM